MANTTLTSTAIRAAIARTVAKLARQRDAVLASEAEIAMYEGALRDAEANEKKAGK